MDQGLLVCSGKQHTYFSDKKKNNLLKGDVYISGAFLYIFVLVFARANYISYICRLRKLGIDQISLLLK